jgi:hypothetical protein
MESNFKWKIFIGSVCTELKKMRLRVCFFWYAQQHEFERFSSEADCFPSFVLVRFNDLARISKPPGERRKDFRVLGELVECSVMLGGLLD